MIHGYAVHAAGAEIHSFKYEPGELCPDDVEVAVSHCAVSRSDVHLIDNDWASSKFPFVPGHEIVGTVSAIGDAVQHLKVGETVGVGWQAGSCGHCQWCRRGEENLCAQMELTCVGRHGGFADKVRVNARFAVPIPEGMDSATTAPLLCGGVTVYSPMRRHGIHPASRVGVVGMGGLGHLALQFGRAFGAEVTAFSSSPSKEEDARKLGAHHFLNIRETKSLKAVAGQFDLILSTIDAEQDWSAYVQALRPHGALVFAGSLPKPVLFQVQPLISCIRAVSGSNIGNPVQIAEMLEVAARHKIAAMVETYPLRDANAAVERTRKGTARYRAVLAVG